MRFGLVVFFVAGAVYYHRGNLMSRSDLNSQVTVHDEGASYV